MGRLQKGGAPKSKAPVYDVVQKYKTNMAAAASLGDALGIQTLFFWQPVPVDNPDHAPARELAVRIRQAVNSGSFHFIADLFGGMNAADVYVDRHHYGDTASERIAEVIARQILTQIPAR